MTALVTGATGFVGRWLVAELQATGAEVRTIARRSSGGPGELTVDVTDRGSLERALVDSRPQHVYHLAGVASNAEAAADPARAVAINAGGTANLLEACVRLSPPPVVLVASSGEVYGGSLAGAALDEATAPEPMSVYGATKLAQEVMALSYHRAAGLPVTVTRTFNLVGPGQSPAYALPSFALQLAAVEAGRQPPVLRVGNLGVRRDFTDVRDAVRAYRLLVEGRHTGTPFNVSSGHAVTISELLDLLISISGVSVSVEVDPRLVRAVDPRVAIGSNSLIAARTGWAPTIPLEQTLRDVWADARLRLAAGR